jgi:hypothetical protein
VASWLVRLRPFARGARAARHPLRPAELAELLASVDLGGVAVWVVGRRAPTTVATHPSAAATCAGLLAVERAWMAFNSIGVTWGKYARRRRRRRRRRARVEKLLARVQI